MAIFLTEAMTVPAGVFKAGYRPIPSEFRSGISLSLDTPPSRPAFVVQPIFETTNNEDFMIDLSRRQLLAATAMGAAWTALPKFSQAATPIQLSIEKRTLDDPEVVTVE